MYGLPEVPLPRQPSDDAMDAKSELLLIVILLSVPRLPVDCRIIDSGSEIPILKTSTKFNMPLKAIKKITK
jgi:hypothetical protein